MERQGSICFSDQNLQDCCSFVGDGGAGQPAFAAACSGVQTLARRNLRGIVIATRASAPLTARHKQKRTGKTYEDTMIRLDIFSDPVCPWCLVGKAQLDLALAANPGHPFVIQWHPFQLNPNLPVEGVEKRAYLERAFGGAARVDAVHERLREIARNAGLDLDPDLPQRIPNTLKAHQLIHWAGIEGAQGAVVSALFNAYWLEGRDIGAENILADIAAQAGLDRTATLRLLQSGVDAEDILARDQDARKKGVSAVPTYLIAQQYVVSGAQPPEVWGEVIAELTSKLAIH